MSKKKPKVMAIDPMNDLGEFPAAETILAWIAGVTPTDAKRHVNILEGWLKSNGSATFLRLCESPVERLFALGFSMGGDVEPPGSRPTDWTDCDSDEEPSSLPALLVGRDTELYLLAQREVAGFRVDFVLMGEYGDPLLHIEIDGHEWHERTKEQAAADRDRELTILEETMTPVVRFTGSQVYAKPAACARRAYDIAAEFAMRDRRRSNFVRQRYLEGHAAGYAKRGTALVLCSHQGEAAE